VSVIIGFVLAALVLVFFEVILPGGILGGLGALCILVATWFGFDTYGLLGGVGVLLGALLAVGILVFVEFKLLARTPLGQCFFLKTAVDGHTRAAPAADSIIGKQGAAVTRLSPSGMVEIDGQQFEAYSQDGYIERGHKVAVVSKDNFKLTIKKI
jgi:membrane-bound serine protease (ClpP class)